jgi:hypothetical protein
MEEARMKEIVKKAGIAALVAAASLAGMAGGASAQGVDIYVGPGHHRPPPPDYGRPPPPPPGFGRGCDPRQAEDIARGYGLRHARVADITPRRVIVNGFGRRGPDSIVFANVRGCPIMGR